MSQNGPGSGNRKGARNPAIAAAWIGAAAVVAGAVITGVFTLMTHGSEASSSPSQPSSGPPVTLSTSASAPPSGTAWLDQLTPTSGEVSESDAAPDTTMQGTVAPLPHELLIAPAENGNIVSYTLGGAYKALNLEVATTGNASSTAGTSLSIDIDGTPFPLYGSTDVKDFFPGLTEPTNWIINVSGAQKLQLTLGNVNGVTGTSLLVSGSLTD